MPSSHVYNISGIIKNGIQIRNRGSVMYANRGEVTFFYSFLGQMVQKRRKKLGRDGISSILAIHKYISSVIVKVEGTRVIKEYFCLMSD